MWQVRMQAQEGQGSRYPSTAAAFASIYKVTLRVSDEYGA